METITTARFNLGHIVATPGAIEAPDNVQRIEMLLGHARGDWGIMCKEDQERNDEALKLGNRILSAYAIDPAKSSKGYGHNTLWIITEADRNVTTFLLPSEY